MKIKINEKDLRKYVRKIMKETILEARVNELSPELIKKARHKAYKSAKEHEYGRKAYNMGNDTIGDYQAGPIEKKLGTQVDTFRKGEEQRKGHPFYDPRHPEYKQHSKKGGKVHPDYQLNKTAKPIGKDIEEFWVDTTKAGDEQTTGYKADNHPMDLGKGFDFSSKSDKPSAFGKLGKALSGPKDTTHHDSRPGSFYALSHKKEGHNDVKELGDTLKSIGKIAKEVGKGAKAVGKKAKRTVKKTLQPKEKAHWDKSGKQSRGWD
tara:strand:+ start:1387 stop:2178 length:792 start_codon:yes stop_codon:yes gene_type:complete